MRAHQSIRVSVLPFAAMLWMRLANRINVVSQPIIFWASLCCVPSWLVSPPTSRSTLTAPLKSAPSCPPLPAIHHQLQVSSLETLVISLCGA